MELGKRIAEIRKDRGLTQEELAELCSVTRQTISNWENGKSYPDLETLVLISDTFDVSLDAILKGDRKMVSKISKDQQHGKNFALKLIAAIVLTVAVVLGGYSYAYLHETYIPYEETGVTVSGSGTIHTDRNYSCFYGSSYVTETVGDEMHYVEFLYLTSSIHWTILVPTLQNIAILDHGKVSANYRTRGGEWRGCIAATPHIYMESVIR